MIFRKQILTAAALIAPLLILAACEQSDPTAPASSTVTLTANPSTVDLSTRPSGNSAITASAADKDGKPLSGIKVYFSTTAGTMRSGDSGVATNGSGRANDVLTLRQGDGSATVTGQASGATKGTVSVSVREAGDPTISVTANPATVDLTTATSGTSTITATVRADGGGPLVGANVIFSATAGQITGADGVPTNASGVATSTLTVTQSISTSTVKAELPDYNSISKTVVVTVLKPASGNNLTVIASPGAIDLRTAASGTTEIIASVRKVADNSPVQGVSVTFSTNAGILTAPTTAVTDSSGLARDILTMTLTDSATATVTATSTGLTPATVQVPTLRPAR